MFWLVVPSRRPSSHFPPRPDSPIRPAYGSTPIGGTVTECLTLRQFLVLVSGFEPRIPESRLSASHNSPVSTFECCDALSSQPGSSSNSGLSLIPFCRSSPSLIRRYGGPTQAAETFAAKAMTLINQNLDHPNLVDIQALCLIIIHEWGSRNAVRAPSA